MVILLNSYIFINLLCDCEKIWHIIKKNQVKCYIYRLRCPLSLFLCCLFLLLVVGQLVACPPYIAHTLPNSTLNLSLMISSDPDLQSTVIRYLNPILILVAALTSRIITIFLLKPRSSQLFNSLDSIEFLANCLVPKLGTPSWTYFIIGFFILSSGPVHGLYLYNTYVGGSLLDMFWSTLLSYNNLSAFSSDLQFIDFSLFLASRFRLINTYLKKYRRNSLSNITIANLIYKWRQNEAGWSRLLGQMRLDSEEPKIENIEVALEMHKRLSLVVLNLNHIYQLHLISSLLISFLKLLFNVYFSIFTPVPESVDGARSRAKMLLWSIFYLLRFLSIVLAASLATKEVSGVCCSLSGIGVPLTMLL